MTPLVLVAALGAFVPPHSSRDVRPAIVARRVEPPPTVHPVREFVGRCVDPEVPAPTSEVAEAVIIIGLFLLQALFCPCCRMVLAMPAKVASTVASTVGPTPYATRLRAPSSLPIRTTNSPLLPRNLLRSPLASDTVVAFL